MQIFVSSQVTRHLGVHIRLEEDILQSSSEEVGRPSAEGIQGAFKLENISLDSDLPPGFIWYTNLPRLSLPGGSHQFSLCHAKLGIDINLDIMYLFPPA